MLFSMDLSYNNCVMSKGWSCCSAWTCRTTIMSCQRVFMLFSMHLSHNNCVVLERAFSIDCHMNLCGVRSVITLLQDCLGGNAKTVMVANISPAAVHVKDTTSTLGFAQRAKMIKNKVGIGWLAACPACSMPRALLCLFSPCLSVLLFPLCPPLFDQSLSLCFVVSLVSSCICLVPVSLFCCFPCVLLYLFSSCLSVLLFA